MTHDLYNLFKKIQITADWVGLRYVEENNIHVFTRNNIPRTNMVSYDSGYMVEVMVDGQLGYASTSNPQQIPQAASRALLLAKSSAPYSAISFTTKQRPATQGHYSTTFQKKFDIHSMQYLNKLLLQDTQSLKVSDKIINSVAAAILTEVHTHWITSHQGEVQQHFQYVTDHLSATAQEGLKIQTRTLGGPFSNSYQGGLEIFENGDRKEIAQKIGHEAVELLTSPPCPCGSFDLLLMPDQMALQIHESIGHPLELDRILGDELNYAGSSFVKISDFGHLQYGSSQLNVVFDPHQKGQFASCQYDDVGAPAQREHLIKNGILMRGLGGLESQWRSGILGVANQKTCSWNRPPIDRISNLNIEPGDASLEDLIQSISKGILMISNRSWSIDDQRVNFQFGCEYGKLIEDGQIKQTVCNPNYRGKTVPFWNQLKKVGNHSTFETYGSPFCGKGEPNQLSRVGHASPACLFSNVEIFSET